MQFSSQIYTLRVWCIFEDYLFMRFYGAFFSLCMHTNMYVQARPKDIWANESIQPTQRSSTTHVNWALPSMNSMVNKMRKLNIFWRGRKTPFFFLVTFFSLLTFNRNFTYVCGTAFGNHLTLFNVSEWINVFDFILRRNATHITMMSEEHGFNTLWWYDWICLAFDTLCQCDEFRLHFGEMHSVQILVCWFSHLLDATKRSRSSFFPPCCCCRCRFQNAHFVETDEWKKD